MGRKRKADIDKTTPDDMLQTFKNTYPTFRHQVVWTEAYDVGRILIFLGNGTAVVYDDIWTIYTIVEDDWISKGRKNVIERMENLRNDVGFQIQRELVKRNERLRSIHDKQTNRDRHRHA